MNYRKFGKTGEEISILGFGAMRLPVIDGDNAKIDYAKGKKMVRYAIDQGVNYLDTAYPYHGGTSEAFCAQVMKDGYREKVHIATKLPSWEIKDKSDFDRLLNEQLSNLEVEYIDFYLVHALSKKHWTPVLREYYKDFLDRAKAEGKIRYAGFSFHDDLDLFKEISDDYAWDFCQIQLNYLDENYQAGLKGMDYAHKKGFGIIIMEPLRGGTLAKTELPEDIQSLWDSAKVRRTPAQWALKYLWNKPEVGTILSGMSNMEQTIENVQTASEKDVAILTEEEEQIINQVKHIFNDRMVVNCTNCKYCMPCPQGVNIPENFWALNHDSMFDDLGKAKYWVNGWLQEHQRPSNCVECGLCEAKCPQNIKIVSMLKIVKEKYEES